MLRLGKRLAVMQVTVHSEGHGEPVAHATGTYSIPPPNRAREEPRSGRTVQRLAATASGGSLVAAKARSASCIFWPALCMNGA